MTGCPRMICRPYILLSKLWGNDSIEEPGTRKRLRISGLSSPQADTRFTGSSSAPQLCLLGGNLGSHRAWENPRLCLLSCLQVLQCAIWSPRLLIVTLPPQFFLLLLPGLYSSVKGGPGLGPLNPDVPHPRS